MTWPGKAACFRTLQAPSLGTLRLCREESVDIRELRVVRGGLPRRALALVLEWAAEHRDELMEDWDLCSKLEPPKPIPPLE